MQDQPLGWEDALEEGTATHSNNLAWRILWTEEPGRLHLHPWDFLGKSTGVGCHSLLQGIFPTWGLNPLLLQWQADSLLLSYQGSPL